MAVSVSLLCSCGMEPIAMTDSDAETSVSAPDTDTTAAGETTGAASGETTGLPVAETTVPETAAETIVPAATGIPAGVWWGVGNNDDWYYEFRSDTEGRLVYQSMGIGLGFEYERSGDLITFHMGSAENIQKATVSDERENRITLSFDGGDVQVLTRQDAATIDDFRFYCTKDLIDMASAKLLAETGKKTVRNETEIDEDGKIVIQLYSTEEKDEKPYTVTVDRFTGKGTDSSGKNVDLTPYAPGSAQ